MSRVLYLAVTNDIFELPLIVEENLKRMSEKMNINYNTVRSGVQHERVNRELNFKYKRIYVDDEE
jgi:hypothetical protein